jgi:thiol-disulfide isomerase/thioredoxin
MNETNKTRRLSPALILLILPVLGVVIGAALILNERETATPDFVPLPPTPEPVVLPTLVDVVDAPVIDFELPVFGREDDTLRLSDLAGRVVFLNFWATWCEPCKRELPTFAQFGRDNPDADDPLIIAVNYGETPQQIADYFAQNQIDGLNVLLDQDQRAGDSYGIFNLPVTFVIDQRGIVRYPKYGEITLDELYGYAQALEEAS